NICRAHLHGNNALYEALELNVVGGLSKKKNSEFGDRVRRVEGKCGHKGARWWILEQQYTQLLEERNRLRARLANDEEELRRLRAEERRREENNNNRNRMS
ncbi:4129_t:CDS:2, partial [Racocetra persica]